MERPPTAGVADLGREQQFEALLCLISIVQALQPKSAKSQQGHYRAGPKEKPSGEEIKLRAYEIFIERGGVQGSDVEDWLQAERELLDKALEDHPRGERV